MAVIDSARLLYEWLKADSGVVAEVGTNIYGPPGLPNNFAITKAVMFLGDGGSWDEALPVADGIFQVRCYGETAAEARSVWRTVAAALHHTYGNITVGAETWGLGYAVLVSGPADMMEPEIGWPFVLGTFVLRFVRVPMP